MVASDLKPANVLLNMSGPVPVAKISVGWPVDLVWWMEVRGKEVVRCEATGASGNQPTGTSALRGGDRSGLDSLSGAGSVGRRVSSPADHRPTAARQRQDLVLAVPLRQDAVRTALFARL